MCLMVGSNALVINFTVMLKATSIHHAQRTYALETKVFFSNGNETRTHEGFINTYATRTAKVESTELPVYEEEWQKLSLGESPDIRTKVIPALAIVLGKQ
jgi:hypothetical protein